jgi:MFS family permease
VLWAMVSEAFRPANMAILSDLVPAEQRKAVYALNRLAINLGMAIGPAMGGFLAALSYRWVFWIDGITSLLSFLVIASFLRHAPPHQAVQEPSARGQSAWHDTRFLLFLLALLPVTIVFFQHEGPLPLYLVRDLKFGPSFYGTLFTVNTLVIVAMEVRLNLAMSHWSHRRSLMLGCLLYAFGFGATGFFPSKAWIILTVVIWTFGEMVLMPSLADAVASMAPNARRGEYMGLFQLSFSISMSLGPWLGTHLYEQAGPGWLWLACFLAASLSAVIFALLLKRETEATA